MSIARSPLRLLFLLLALVLPAAAQDANTNPLPNAPVPAHVSDTKEYAPSKWYGVVDPKVPFKPLSPADKLVFWLHEEASPFSLVPAVFSAGYGQLTDGDPKYGVDSPAFGERLGAAALRDASMRFFSDSLLPTITRTDPRYYRMGSGPYGRRVAWAAERLVIVENDSDKRVVNYSDLLGRLGGAALTTTYYPERSVNVDTVLKTWGTSLVGAVGGNLFYEFWPDVRDAVFHHNHKSRPGVKDAGPVK